MFLICFQQTLAHYKNIRGSAGIKRWQVLYLTQTNNPTTLRKDVSIYTHIQKYLSQS